MSANNLLLGLGDNKDKNYTYIVKGTTGTDVRELVKVVNATGVATTIYTYPANYYCLYTLQDDDYIYSVMKNSSLHYIYKTHKTTYVTTNSASISINGYYTTLDRASSGFAGDYIVLSFDSTLYTIKIHKQTFAVSTYNSNSLVDRIKCLLPNGTNSYAFSSNVNGTCTWYKYSTYNFSLQSTGTFSNFTVPYEDPATYSTDFNVAAISNTRLMLHYNVYDGNNYYNGYNVIDVGAGSPVLLRGANSAYKQYYIQNSNKKANDSNWLYGFVYPPKGLGKYSNAASGTDLPVHLLETASYAEPIYYDNALYTVSTNNYKDIYKYNLLNGSLNKLFTLVGNYNYNSYLYTMLVSNK